MARVRPGQTSTAPGGRRSGRQRAAPTRSATVKGFPSCPSDTSLPDPSAFDRALHDARPACSSGARGSPPPRAPPRCRVGVRPARALPARRSRRAVVPGALPTRPAPRSTPPHAHDLRAAAPHAQVPPEEDPPEPDAPLSRASGGYIPRQVRAPRPRSAPSIPSHFRSACAAPVASRGGSSNSTRHPLSLLAVPHSDFVKLLSLAL